MHAVTIWFSWDILGPEEVAGPMRAARAWGDIVGPFLFHNQIAAHGCSVSPQWQGTIESAHKRGFVERTFIAIKPDGVQRALIGTIVQRFEQKGFKLVGLKLIQVTEELAHKHYAEHEGKGFFKGLVSFITSGPVVVMVWEGKGVISTARAMMGTTNPLNAPLGTIRGDFGADIGRNIIHGSDGPESAQREIALWFSPEELLAWTPTVSPWIYE